MHGPDRDTVPCSDPRGCPDLWVDARFMRPHLQRQTFGPDHCEVQEGSTSAGTRSLLRFSFVTPNDGPGDLVVGPPDLHPEWFTWGACHGHMHFREYADYRLWTPAGYARWDALRTARPDLLPADILAADADLAAELVTGTKQGFCVIDVLRYSETFTPPKYLDCDVQGISVGWADVYGDSIPGQYVDVTGVPPGSYVLEAEVNAERFFEESDYADNRAALGVSLPGPDLVVGPGDVSVSGEGRFRTVTATVRNAGDAPAAAVVVRVEDGGVAIGEATVDQLGPGVSATVAVPWDTVGRRDRELTVAADPDGTVAEWDETNNVVTTDVRLTGP
jgi:hypothetical protein